MPAQTPSFELETHHIAAGRRIVAGVDEVGRGPMAGPVTAAAVILDPDHIPEGLADSKTISASKRDALAKILQACAHVSIAEASVQEIEELNIGQASLLAMTRAVAGLCLVPDHVLVDGNRIPPAFAGKATAIVKGDQRSASIAAASIVAKVDRDARMAALAEAFPGYGWDKNAGYITQAHKAALVELGVTPHHRRLYAPVQAVLRGKQG